MQEYPMNPTLNLLQGELERLYDIKELVQLCENLLGFDPEAQGFLGGGKAALVRRIVERCQAQQATLALTDAVMLTKRDLVDPRLKKPASLIDDEPLAAGTAVGAHQVVEARGAFPLGQVYNVRRVLPGESPGDEAGLQGPLYRLEVVSGAWALDGQAVQRYLMALRLQRRISSPYLPRVYEVGQLDDGRPWLITDSHDGAWTLADTLLEGPPALTAVWPVVEGVCRALEALHGHGLIHGDVKPEHVLLLPPTEPAAADGEAGEVEDNARSEEDGPFTLGSAQFGRVLLLGAGSTRLLSWSVRGGETCAQAWVGVGTPKSLAPEQARGRTLEVATDVYGLGALLYEVTTGQPVFSGRSALDVVARHLEAQPQPMSSHVPAGRVSPELDDLVLQLLHKESHRRPSSVAEVRRSLAECVARFAVSTATGESDEEVRVAAELFAEDTTDNQAADELEAAGRRASAWSVVIEAYRQALSQAEEGALQRGLQLRLARVLADEVGDHGEAEALYQALWEADPADEAVDEALVTVRRKRGRYDELVAQLLARAERKEEPGERAAVLRRVASICEEKTGTPDQAFTVLLALLSIELTAELLDDLGRLADGTGRWNDLVQTCAAQAQQAQAPADVLLLTSHLGRWYAEKLGRPDYAIACFQQALTVDPGHDDALRGMEEVYRRQQQWLELTQVLLARAERSTHPEVRRDSLAETAAIFADRLNDPGRAVELFTHVLQEDPAHPVSLEAMERIYTRREAWQELLALYQAHEEALLESGEKARLWSAMGALYEVQLGDEEQAVAAYRRALELDGEDRVSRRALMALYERKEASPELMELLAAELDAADTPRQRVALHERRAHLFETEFVDAQAAIAEYQKLLEIDGTHHEALTRLALLLRQQEQWAELADLYERHLSVTDDQAQRFQLLCDRAELLSLELGEHQDAADALAEAARLQPQNLKVHDELGRQRLRTDDFAGAVAALEQVALLASSDDERARTWARIGELYERKLQAPDEAEVAYRKALDADRTHVAAAAALQDLYVARGQLTAGLDMLERQFEAATGDLEQARILIEMAYYCRDRLGQPTRALEYFQQAIGLDKSNSAVVEPLGELYLEQERWVEAAVLYSGFADTIPALSVETQVALWRAWGEACLHLGQPDEAASCFVAALGQDEDHARARFGLAEALYQAQRWTEAKPHYERLAAATIDEQDLAAASSQARLLCRLAEVCRRTDDGTAAEAAVAEALALTPDLVEARRLQVELAQDQGNHEAAAVALREWADALADGPEKAAVLVQLAAAQTEMEDLRAAAATYGEALDHQADERLVLMRLMSVYNQAKEWSQLVEVVLKIADMETEPAKIARFYQTAAMINQRQLDQPEVAREYFELAVEHDPSLISAFTRLTEILEQKGAWEDLARLYRTMLERLPQDFEAQERLKLLDGLGNLLLNRLDRAEEAIPWYEQAVLLEPDHRSRLEALAEAYGTRRAFADQAVAVHHELLAKNSFREASYKALRAIYGVTDQLDEQWCCARTMTCLRLAEEDEEALYRKYRRDDIPAPGDSLSEEDWQNYLLPSSMHRTTTRIFETILPAVWAAHGRPHKAFNLELGDERKANDDHPFGSLVRFAAGTLGMDGPSLFFRDQVAETASLLPTNPPAILAGSVALEAAQQQPRALAFVVGRLLGYLRGGNIMRVVMESDAMLRAWLVAAQKHVAPDLEVPPHLADHVVACGAKLSECLSDQAREALHSLVAAYFDSGSTMDLHQWVVAVDVAADRAGLLLCDDVETASQLIRLEQASPSPTKERLKELYLFSVHPHYFALRKKLRIQVSAAS
jgi:tetratricopeptide (TPR) repeat protein